MEPLLIIAIAIIAAFSLVLCATMPFVVCVAGLYLIRMQDSEAKTIREQMRHERALAKLDFESGQTGDDDEDGLDFMGIINNLVPGLMGPQQPVQQEQPNKEIENGKTC